MTAAAVATEELQAPARSSSFYIAMRLLPRDQREAMLAIYAFCRAVDDIADSPLDATIQMAQLHAWGDAIDRFYDDDGPLAIAGLGHAIRSYGLDRRDFHAVIDGMRMDVAKHMVAPDWAALDLYCDRVASAVGRLSVKVFGVEPALGVDLAHHLGRALQLTNILRDVDEDAEMGRLYLPREALAEASLDNLPIDEVLVRPEIDVTCRAVADAAQNYFIDADRIMDGCARDVVRAPRLMAASYQAMLKGLLVRGWQPPRFRVSRSKIKLVPALVRSFLF